MTFLGIDIGTTSVKLCLLDGDRNVLFTKSKVHEAEVATPFPERHEQNPEVILRAVEDLLEEIDVSQVKRVCIGGQMHGIVVWDAKFHCATNLVTWMDGRCDAAFLKTLPEWPHSQMAPGFGCATLVWLRRNGAIPENGGFRAGTIMDYVAARFCGVWNVPMCILNAYGLGLCEGREWILKDPLLPEIVSPDTVIGKWNNAEVTVASADLQTTLLPLCQDGVAVLNLGTSSQLCFSIASIDAYIDRAPGITVVPFYEGKWLVLAASLNGGNVIDLFAKTIAQWGAQLCGSESENLKVDYKLIDSFLGDESEETPNRVSVNSRFFGERYEPESGATVSQWKETASLKQFLRAIAAGVIENLASMMDEAMLLKHGIKKLCLSGKASRGVFRQTIERLYPNLDIQGYADEVSAAYGAAIQAYHSK